MKAKKGEAGYVQAQKTKYLFYSIIEFSIVIAFVLFGIMKTGSRLNGFTIVGIVGCLPASKMLVEYITMMPHKGIEWNLSQEIVEKASLLTVIFDTIITGNEKVMPVQAFVISGNTICGYTTSEKTDETMLAKYLKQLLAQNGYDKVTVKILHDYHAFITRAEGLNNMASVSKIRDQQYENQLKQIILTTSF